LIKLPEGIKIEEVPIEKRYRSITAGLVRRIKILYDTIYERFGEEGLELIRDVGRAYGLEVAERAKKKIKGDDIESVALYVIRVFNTIRGNGVVTKWDKNQVIIRVFECPYPWTKPEVCIAHTTMEKTLVETLGKNLHYSIPKSIPAGDPYCDHVIEYREP
jgi:predicted hydrocarbon binding protein